MRKRVALFAVLLALSLLAGCGEKRTPVSAEPPVKTQETVEPVEPEEPEVPEPITVTLAVCGDTMSHMPLTRDVWNEEKDIYDYSRAMSGAIAYVQAADYAVANLETTLAGGPKYSGYPAFNSPDNLARELKEIGFDLLLTANNHCMDKGNGGLTRTLDMLDGVGLSYMGTSRSQEEYDKNYEIVDISGISVAFLGYTYGTNGIPLPKDAPYAVNVFNRGYLTTLADPNTEKLLADTTAVATVELRKDLLTGTAEVAEYSYMPLLMLDREAGRSDLNCWMCMNR